MSGPATSLSTSTAESSVFATTPPSAPVPGASVPDAPVLTNKLDGSKNNQDMFK